MVNCFRSFTLIVVLFDQTHIFHSAKSVPKRKEKKIKKKLHPVPRSVQHAALELWTSAYERNPWYIDAPIIFYTWLLGAINYLLHSYHMSIAKNTGALRLPTTFAIALHGQSQMDPSILRLDLQQFCRYLKVLLNAYRHTIQVPTCGINACCHVQNRVKLQVVALLSSFISFVGYFQLCVPYCRSH